MNPVYGHMISPMADEGPIRWKLTRRGVRVRVRVRKTELNFELKCEFILCFCKISVRRKKVRNSITLTLEKKLGDFSPFTL